MRAEPVSGIQPNVLQWARESANISVEDVAKKLKKSLADVEAWEKGESAPSYAQLEKLAYSIYKRPLAIFFLPKPPDEPPTKAEFRSLPEHDLSRLDRDTVFLIRKARAFQFALIELFGERSPAERPLWRSVRLLPSASLVEQAAKVRQELGISLNQQRSWESDDDALKQWRRAIEMRGVFVFKHTFKQREISGFCLNHLEFPVIMVNNSTTRTRQIFSLLHELAHILANRSGISTFDESRIEGLPPQDRAIERFCNAIAAEILVPLSDFKTQTNLWTVRPEAAPDESFAALAQRYHVSRAVVLRRFLDEQQVSEAFYQSKVRAWDSQKATEGSGGNYYNTQGAYISERFLKEVFSRYSRRQLSKEDAADLIGIAPKSIARFEDIMLRGVDT
jgi:Zn-dependent peptidase ImmA (M78 family)